MWSLLAGFIGGFIAWIATELLAKPFARFLQIRSDVAMALALYEEQAWRFEEEEFEPPNADWLQKRKESYETHGSALMAFAASQNLVTRLLQLKILRTHRCDVYAAGSLLKALSEVRPATSDADEAYSAVLSGLKLKRL